MYNILAGRVGNACNYAAVRMSVTERFFFFFSLDEGSIDPQKVQLFLCLMYQIWTWAHLQYTIGLRPTCWICGILFVPMMRLRNFRNAGVTNMRLRLHHHKRYGIMKFNFRFFDRFRVYSPILPPPPIVLGCAY